MSATVAARPTSRMSRDRPCHPSKYRLLLLLVVDVDVFGIDDVSVGFSPLGRRSIRSWSASVRILCAGLVHGLENFVRRLSQSIRRLVDAIHAAFFQSLLRIGEGSLDGLGIGFARSCRGSPSSIFSV